MSLSLGSWPSLLQLETVNKTTQSVVTSTKLCVWSLGYLGDVGQCSLESLWHRDAINIEVELCLILSSGRQSERYTDRVGTTTNRQLHIHTIILISSIIKSPSSGDYQCTYYNKIVRMRAIPESLRGVFTTKRYTNLRLPHLTKTSRPLYQYVASSCCGSGGLAIKWSLVRVSAGHYGVKTLGKFLTAMCLCHQAV